jgi:hypothetical protein
MAHRCPSLRARQRPDHHRGPAAWRSGSSERPRYQSGDRLRGPALRFRSVLSGGEIPGPGGRGSGPGLAIARYLVEAHGGASESRASPAGDPSPSSPSSPAPAPQRGFPVFQGHEDPVGATGGPSHRARVYKTHALGTDPPASLSVPHLEKPEIPGPSIGRLLHLCGCAIIEEARGPRSSTG